MTRYSLLYVSGIIAYIHTKRNIQFTEYSRKILLNQITSCLQVKAEKDYLLEWQRKCRRDAAKQKMKDEQLPYVGAAIGIGEFRAPYIILPKTSP